MPKVSVIIPIYGVEKYIERCARSLFEQTLDDIEYIFIDDCTPDNSMIVLQSIIEKYRFRLDKEKKVVRIEKMPSNSGLTAVRSHGMQLALGEYVIHCDSDDWVDRELYETMYKAAVRSNADIVKCPICDEYKDGSVMRPFNNLPSSCNEILENWWYNSVGMFCWNKMVRRSVYTNNELVSFDGINMWEDNGLMLRVFYYAKGFSQIEGPAYHYNQANQGAMTNGYTRDKIDQMLKCAHLIACFFESKPDGEKYLKTVLTLKYLAKLNFVSYRYNWLKEFYQIFPESDVAADWINLKAFSKKGKIRFLFVKYHLAWLFVFIFKCLTWKKLK